MPVGESVTGHINLGIAERFQKKLVVIDTPGLFDTNKKKDNTDILREISKCYAVTSPGIHAIILTIPIGRITDNIDETVNIFLSYFGNEATSVMLIVFTFKAQLEIEEMPFETYINSIPKESPLYTVLKQVNGRYLAFGYKGEKADRDEEVKQLLDMIDRNVENLPDGSFSNEMFRELEQYLRDEEEAAKYYEQWKEKKEYKETNRDRLRRSIVDDIIEFFDPYFEYFSQLYKSMVYQ
ncbi:GTPase IMAP family member 7-like [Saccostrea echinata]|uniref:GTPase IMAP family member 7-like n=1 Tax=Saccostrea echinata TaxID=191078 RepID=UPI002A7F4682|nr:GTPase IMAP family member 7-like [Saccostrea echinata]